MGGVHTTVYPTDQSLVTTVIVGPDRIVVLAVRPVRIRRAADGEEESTMF